MLAFDFWTVKNISGRLLVGYLFIKLRLRWWNEIKDDGTSEWVFESRENSVNNSVDKSFFWWGLYSRKFLFKLALLAW